MMVCFAGGLLVAPLCGEPVLPALVDDPVRLLIASALWYVMFYSPKDLAYDLSKKAKLPLYVVKGMYYPKKVLAGISHAKHVFKRNILAGVVIATCKGNGSGLIKPFARLARGKWSPDVFESVKPSLTTKYCAVFALIYSFFPWDSVFVVMTIAMVTMKVGPLLDKDVDPFVKVEDKIAPILFGKKAEKDKEEEVKEKEKAQ